VTAATPESAGRERPAPGDGGDDGAVSIHFIGAATVLIRAAGFAVLTDPAFLRRGERARLGYGLRSARRTDPALAPAELPPLDLVVLSHLHGDHFDRAAARALPASLPIVTTPDGAATLRRNGFGAAHGLRTWQTFTAAKDGDWLRVTALPAQHAYGVLGRILPPVMGSLIEFETAPYRRPWRLYVSGDTLVTPALAGIAARYPDIDVMLPHLGGTRLLGLFLATMDGRQGVALMRLVPARTVIPIHYDDFTVYKSPLEDFRREVAAAGLEDRVRYLRRGETYALPPAEAADV
jgi:L-ascorbate metabolism protein UlaG (beta-lactamase superfamily)